MQRRKFLVATLTAPTLSLSANSSPLTTARKPFPVKAGKDRFDQSVKLKNAQPSKDWLSIALELGYHDYQHLVRDYKAFTQLTPTLFYQRERHAPERSFGKAET